MTEYDGIVRENQTLQPTQTSPVGPPKCMLTECISAGRLLITVQQIQHISSANFLDTQLYGSMDTSANACDDFYKYACGKYNNDHPLPANVDGWSHFYRLQYEVRNNLRGNHRSHSSL